MLSRLNHKNNKNIILAGDFNVNLLNQDSHHETRNFLNIMYAQKNPSFNKATH